MQATSYSIASGSTDAIVCLWDTLTGSCVHKLRGHISCVLSVTCSQDHVMSVGMDNRLCVWKRRRGRLLHVIQMVSRNKKDYLRLNCLMLLMSSHQEIFLKVSSPDFLTALQTVVDVLM